MNYYIIVLLVYFGTDVLAVWGFNLEFGVAGVGNLAYIVLVAVGAYTYGVLTLGSSAGHGGFQNYFLGASWSPYLAMSTAVAVASAVGVIIGLSGLRRLRGDYQAVVMLMIAILATTIVNAEGKFLNGINGISLIPNPLGSSGGGWSYVGLVGLVCVLALGVMRKFTAGPMGRVFRAVRDNEDAALAIGKNVVMLRLLAQAVGGAFAGLSGALLAGFLGAWSPSAWGFAETLVFAMAVIIGGTGNDLGVSVGALLVPVLIIQGVQLLPAVHGAPDLIPDLSWILVGIVTFAFLFVWPRGLIPERVQRIRGVAPLPERDAPALATEGAEKSFYSRRSAAVSVARTYSERRSEVPILEVRDLECHFEGLRAVDSVSFSVPKGSIVGLIGPNGAGKSTTIGILGGFVKPNAGSIVLDGEDVSGLPAFRRARRGLVRTFQLPHEFGELTIMDNLLVAVPHHRGESLQGIVAGRPYWRRHEGVLMARAMELLERFGMESKAFERAKDLSGGQKRMVEIMRALMVEPKVLLLDEPMAGLSGAVVQRLEEICASLREEGMSIVLIEHELGSVERLCDHVVVMAQGRILSEGSLADLRLDEKVQDAYLVG